MGSATTRSAPYLLVSGHTLPRAARALQSRRSAPTKRPWWRQLWPPAPRAPSQPCDRCGRSMHDFLQTGAERLCIRCVADAQEVPQQSPELAGALAVLRTLLMELELEWRAQLERPFEDRRRFDAAREAAEVVLWWLTPRKMRTPAAAAVGERTALEVLAAYDRVWTLRTSVGTLRALYEGWRSAQAKQQCLEELDAVDRRYVALIAHAAHRHPGAETGPGSIALPPGEPWYEGGHGTTARRA